MGQFRFNIKTKEILPMRQALKCLAKQEKHLRAESILKLFEEGSGERPDMTDFTGCENILVEALEAMGGKNWFTLSLCGMKDLPFGLHVLTIWPGYGNSRNARFTWKHFDEDSDTDD